MRTKPAFSLTAWLTLLIVCTVLPLLLLAGAALFQISQTSQVARDRGQLDTARALALAVDGEVRSWKAALMALLVSRNLQQGRLAEFYEEARQVAAQHDGWIVLTDPSHQQLLNTLRPYGAPLPMTSAPEVMRAVFENGKPVVTDVIFGKVAQRFIVAVAVPVLRENKVAYALDMSFGPERLTQLLRRQQVPASWVAGILDRQRVVVGRSIDADARVGKPVMEWLAAATRAAENGIVRGPLRDGRPGQAAFQRLQEVPWVLALAVPISELPSQRAFLIFLLVGALVGVAAVGMAVRTGRTLTDPVARLAAAGEPLVRGEAVDVGPPSAIRQVQDLQRATVEASAAIQTWHQERQQVEASLREANTGLEARVLERTAALQESNVKLEMANLQAQKANLHLANTNATLQQEIEERKRAEAALQQARHALERRVQERTAELSQAVRTLEEQSEKLRGLASELTLTEQRERRRLATILHDEHQQLLAAAKLRLVPLERMEDPLVRGACREVSGLLEEVLENSRSLSRELSPPILHTGGLVPAVHWLARWMDEKHHLKVDVQADETAVPESEDLIILLFQALREALFNIIKHAGVRAAKVQVVRRGDRVHIVVSDMGTGFDPATLERAEGSGLISSRGRLKLLGGSLDIDSAPGQGSRITLTAPLQRIRGTGGTAPSRLDTAEPGTRAVGASPEASRTGKIRILVVDDHAVVRQGLARLLTAEPDMEIVGEAANGETAVALALELRPDVITMDISMPGMSGIRATRLIRAQLPSVHIIGLSMFEEAEQATAMVAAGAAAYLTKSAAADALVAAIRNCVRPRGESAEP
jgi:signal transduction histidine kinase/ActR/RegA family two-component response regulator